MGDSFWALVISTTAATNYSLVNATFHGFEMLIHLFQQLVPQMICKLHLSPFSFYLLAFSSQLIDQISQLITPILVNITGSS